MGFEHLQSEIDQLEAWLAEYRDPEPRAECLEAVKQQVRREFEHQHLVMLDTPEPSQQLAARIKSAVRRELERSGAVAPLQQGLFRRSVAVLMSAAMIGFAVGMFLLNGPVASEQPADALPELLLAYSSDLEQLEADIELIELRTYARGYLLDSWREEPDELQEELEILSTPEYVMDFEMDPEDQGAF